jgi:hypothetical protein
MVPVIRIRFPPRLAITAIPNQVAVFLHVQARAITTCLALPKNLVVKTIDNTMLPSACTTNRARPFGETSVWPLRNEPPLDSVSGVLVGSEVGLGVTMQLVSLLTFATKPSKHTQEWLSVPSLELSVSSHCVLLVSHS